MPDCLETTFRGHRVCVIRAEQTDELKHVCSRLADVFEDAVVFAAKLGWTLQITSIYRTPREDELLGGSRVHCQAPHRAIDVRTRDIDPKFVADLDRHLDESWVYDPGRPKLTVSYGAKHGSGPHLHLQVCNETRRRV